MTQDKNHIPKIDAVKHLRKAIKEGQPYFFFVQKEKDKHVDVIVGGGGETDIDAMILTAMVHNEYVLEHMEDLVKVANDIKVENMVRESIESKLN